MITDSQIRTLMETSRKLGHKATVYVCKIALDEGATHIAPSRVKAARTRCAEILNREGERP